MLKIRIIPTLLYKKPTLVKGIGFDSWRRVGSAMQAVKVYNLREVDELIFLDITATNENRHPDFELIDEIADECFMPLTVGGGVQDVDDFQKLLKVGADKVAINSIVFKDPEIITKASELFGSQCVVVSIDYKCHSNGYYEVYSNSGKFNTGKNPVDYACEVEKLGAGEIILTSIERDGQMEGYDLSLTKAVQEAVNIPVIISGGAGCYEHLHQALDICKVNAVAAASMFHFTEQTPLEAKQYLKQYQYPVRQ